MTSATVNLSYRRLKHDPLFDHEDQHRYYYYKNILDKLIRKSRRSSRFRKVHVRRKLKVRIPGLKKFLRRRARLVKVAWRKVYKRLKESQSHFGDLFAGNYVFMQVTPTPLKYADKYIGNKLASSSSHHLHASSSRNIA